MMDGVHLHGTLIYVRGVDLSDQTLRADSVADAIRRSSIAGAVAMVRNTRPALRRCREESGYSLAQIIERCDTLKEASLQSGVSYRTVRRYARRWGIE